MSAEGPEDVKTKRNVEELDRDLNERLDDGISFAKGPGDGEDAHDLIERSDVAGRPGCANPEGGTGEKEGELETFDRSLFSRKNRVVGKPGREEHGHRTENDQAGCDKAMFPGSGLWLAH